MDMRRKDRAITDIDEIQRILKKAKILHLGLLNGDYPYVVPLHYGFVYAQAEDAFTIYAHSAKEGQKIELIKKSPNVFVEIDTDAELVDGGEIPCKYGSLYSSFMCRGKATLVEDEQEKMTGLKRIMVNQTDKDFEFTQPMIASVAVIRIVIESYTAKANKG